MYLAALVPGVLLGLIGLVIIGYCLWLVLRNLSFLNLSKGREVRRLKQRVELVLRSRSLAERGQYVQCFPLLRNAFILEHIRGNEKLVDAVLEHNLAVLGAILNISEKYPVPLSNLPVIEELLQIRTAISKAYLDSNLTVTKLRGKKAERAETKTAPAWAITEFSKKLKELKEKIDVNRKSLDQEISKLFKRIGQSGEGKEITYH